jgi:hypothetical protein
MTASATTNGKSATVGLGAILPADSIRYSYHGSTPIQNGASIVFTKQTAQINAAPLASANGPYEVSIPIHPQPLERVSVGQLGQALTLWWRAGSRQHTNHVRQHRLEGP